MRRATNLANMARLALVVAFMTAGSTLIAAAQPQPAQARATAAASILRQRVEQLRAKYFLDQMWFRVEIPGRAPLQTATSGGPNALLPVASLSKSVTGIAVALLIQQGKLRLDATLGELLSGYFRQRGATLDPSLTGVTVERLLTHRAGLQTTISSDPFNGLASGAIIPASMLLLCAVAACTMQPNYNPQTDPQGHFRRKNCVFERSAPGGRPGLTTPAERIAGAAPVRLLAFTSTTEFAGGSDPTDMPSPGC